MTSASVHVPGVYDPVCGTIVGAVRSIFTGPNVFVVTLPALSVHEAVNVCPELVNVVLCGAVDVPERSSLQVAVTDTS